MNEIKEDLVPLLHSNFTGDSDNSTGAHRNYACAVFRRWYNDNPFPQDGLDTEDRTHMFSA